MSNFQINELKSGIKNNIELTLKISSNIVGDSNNENNTQVTKLRKAFPNKSSANIKLSKTHLHKIGQSGGFLGRLLGPLLNTGLPLIENVLKPLSKIVLISLGLTAAASATDAAIKKNMFGSRFTTLTISNEEMNGIMKIIKSLEESGLLIKRVSEAIKNEAKNKKEDFSVCYQVH